MIGAVVKKQGSIEVQDIPTPQVGPEDLLVKVGAAAVCGTDVRMYKHGLKRQEDYPLILGHEFSGEVVKGNSSGMFPEGTRVTVAPNIGCGYCDQCVAGNPHLCAEYKAFGINFDGAFAEYVQVPAKAVAQGNVMVLPEGLSFEEAAINEPFSCVYNGIEACRITPGDTVLIIGAGPIGIMHMLLAKLQGAGKVIISDIQTKRIEVVKRFDPDVLVDSSKEDLAEVVRRETGGKGIDVSIIACPSSDAQSLAIEFAAIGGRINFFGGLPKGNDITKINGNIVHYRQLVITGTTRASITQYRRSLKLLILRRIDLKPLITKYIGLVELEDALSGGNPADLKVVVKP